MALNPLAAEFVPRSTMQGSNAAYTGWGRHGKSQRKEGVGICDLDPGASGSSLTNLPKEIMASIVARLDNPADILALALVNKGMLHIASDAALQLRVSSQNPHLITQHHPLQSLPKPGIFRGTIKLDLSGCSAVNGQQIVDALFRMPNVKFLDLSACRKLSPDFLKIALHASIATRPAVGSSGERPLRVLGLQRCFQLDSFALTDVLKAASRRESRLSVVTLSHLSLGTWPEDESTSPPNASSAVSGRISRMPQAQKVPCTSLKVLALHNSRKIGADGLAYLAACCPELEMLLLGGSSLGVPTISREERSQYLEPSTQAEGLSHLGPQILWGVRSLEGYHSRCVSALVDAASGITKLRVLELTFFAAKVVAGVAEQMPGVQVWDLARLESLKAAETRAGSNRRGDMDDSGLTLALSAAANCSSMSRHTPLHAAVETDCQASLRILLRLGGSLEARDQLGATPLFLACEMDRPDCARLLLRAGAELRSRNSSGEAPLYIAALKGHDAIVEELLSAFREQGLKWTESDLYGDRWNPLMAAAVADRHSTAVRLLRAAGPDATSLALATNRYGQSAGHIAARKGCHLLLRALIEAAGNFVALVPDNDDKTPLAVARAHRHESAISLLQEAADAFHAAWPRGEAEAPPPRQQRRKSQAVHGRGAGRRRY